MRVSQPRHCPHCGLYNPPDTERCDRGYRFSTGHIEETAMDTGQRTWRKPLGVILTSLGTFYLAGLLSPDAGIIVFLAGAILLMSMGTLPLALIAIPIVWAWDRS
jgi:hypothetical protein